jgi:hypothetical protein
MSPHFQKGQALSFREHTSSAHAGSSHLESYHRSDANDDPRPSNRVQPGELVDKFVRSQRERVTAPPRKHQARRRNNAPNLQALLVLLLPIRHPQRIPLAKTPALRRSESVAH